MFLTITGSFIGSLSKGTPDLDPSPSRGNNQLIKLQHSFFTPPQSFTSTFNATNQTSFSTGLESTGLNSTFSHPSGVTVFSTSDSAYAAGTSNSTSSAQLSSLLSNHVVPGFLGYLPELRDGQNLTTVGGTTLTVSSRGGDVYINEARIVQADLITDNGVAHVLDKVSSAISFASRVFSVLMSMC